jgi:hypothetical protein
MASVSAQGQVFETDIRILCDSGGGYRILEATLSEPLPGLDEAIHLAEDSGPLPIAVSRQVRWRNSNQPFGALECACPLCGALAFAEPRESKALCPACVMEATDASGRPLHFQNTDISGGMEVQYSDDGTRYFSDECVVRGIWCRAGERRFGGIVLRPIASPDSRVRLFRTDET